jgi:glycosyltransferase involved in cell wall biosynthesis
MKIFRIIARLNVGGPARHVVWLNKYLPKKDFQSVLVTGTVPEGEEDMSYFATEHGINPIFIPEMSRELSPKDVISLFKVFRQMRREKPDIIHTHTAKAGTIGRIAGLLYKLTTFRKVKIIHTFHGHVFHSYYGKRKTQLFLLIEKTLARFATDKIITISEQQRKEICEDFKVGKSQQFTIIPLGIDLEKFSKADEKRHILRNELNIKDDEMLIGLVGRLTEIKNISMFLKVAKLIKESSESTKLKFVIIGDGNVGESLRNEAKLLKLDDLVIFTGNRNDVDVVYAGLDIVGLTSLNEGTPLSLIEAMANGKSVISTAVGGVVDLLGKVETEENGYKICERGISVKSNDAESFATGLLFLANSPQLRKKLETDSKLFVNNRYSKERLITDIGNLYKNLLNF